MRAISLGFVFLFFAMASNRAASQTAGSTLEMYVDPLPEIPKIYAYAEGNDAPKSINLAIGMYAKKWKFHRDLPSSPVFVYGTSADTATFPGPTIEALQGVPFHVKWENHLPRSHILPWDPTIPTAVAKDGGVPAVVHLHGSIHEPQSDGSALAWFTANYKNKGTSWSKTTYAYPNVQHPGNLWYHDHALGLTRVNLLAGLIGAYVVRNPKVEAHWELPSGKDFDRHLVIVDRSFNTDGSIYMNATGNVPSIHPQWRPEYFGDAIVVNGKAWPFLNVQRRKYRFRILNASNARYFRLSLSNGLQFIVMGSDTSYLPAPVSNSTILLSPSEIFDVIIDFSKSTTSEAEITNSAPYPYPNGTAADLPNSRVMKFVIANGTSKDPSRVPTALVNYPAATAKDATLRRYITMYEYLINPDGEPTHLYINGKSFEDPVTEMPKTGSTEVWEVINLTGDNHPLHIHLAEFQAIKVQEIVDLTTFRNCMAQLNDAVRCNISSHATGSTLAIPEYEKTWKNMVKIEPGYMTTVIVKFHLIDTDEPYPFDPTAEPGYVYHCHILDHEDNAMIRPLKLVN